MISAGLFLFCSMKTAEYFDIEPINQLRSEYREWFGEIEKYNRGELSYELIKSSYDHYFRNEEVPLTWLPDFETITSSNLNQLFKTTGLRNYDDLHNWSVKHKGDYWSLVMKLLGIKFDKPFHQILGDDPKHPNWLDGASMNIAESCFMAPPSKEAIVQKDEAGNIKKITYGELLRQVKQSAYNYDRLGLVKGDGVVLYLPFCIESVVLYLGAVYGGYTAVSVADSFSEAELQKRVDISHSRLLITCDGYLYNGKIIDILPKAEKITIDQKMIVPMLDDVNPESFILYQDFMKEGEMTTPAYMPPATTTNILFSSGTTKDPKAIPWTHLTPIKCGGDAFFHHDVHPEDVLTWTTGMGWMMAPWTIYAAFLNKATLALYVGAHANRSFIDFAREARITILGTIPSIVKAWQAQGIYGSRDFWNVRLFSSTGEPSSPDDYFYLMSLSGFEAPVIEYCGGTEIGGGYITGSLAQPASPATFTTPALGLDFLLRDEDKWSARGGEVYLIPPSMGLSESLLNRDHEKEYYEGCPQGPEGDITRRHGDGFEIKEQDNIRFYMSRGRTDDAMNIGGIKISAIEIEEVVNLHEEVKESAAIAVQEGAGPEKLVLFLVTEKALAKDELKKELQQLISKNLNPLFRVYDIAITEKLPRTASNKVMRRTLRKTYQTKG